MSEFLFLSRSFAAPGQATSRKGKTMKKEIKVLIKDLTRQGFEVRLTRRGHHMVSKDGGAITTFPGTPSDWRSLRNSLAALRRAGFIATKFA